MMKYLIQFSSKMVKAARFDFLGSDQWIEDLPLIAVDFSKEAEIAACGRDALRYLKTAEDNIVVCNPFESLETWVADLEFAETYVRWFQQNYLMKKLALFPPLVAVQLLGYERELYEVEKRAIKEAFIHAGAREVWLIPQASKVSLKDLKGVKRKDFHKMMPTKPKVPNSIVTEWSD